MSLFRAYLPKDRLHALSSGYDLPNRSEGAALLADVSGFTRLTETLVAAWGPQRAVEKLSNALDQLFDVMIAENERYGGSVVGISGDAITCWFAAEAAALALAAALAMQAKIQPIIEALNADTPAAPIALKVAVATGAARRFLVGAPDNHLLDVLAGRLLERLGHLQHSALPGEVVVDPATFAALRPYVAQARPRAYGLETVIVVERLRKVPESRPWPPLSDDGIPIEVLRSWVAPAVAVRLEHSPAELFAELRPAVALMLAFAGIDYDTDAEAPAKLDRFVRWVQTVLARYEGLLVDITINEVGSYLYCAFGVPVAHHDDAVRAVAVAMELQARPPKFAFITDIRIGLAAGLARVGAYGSAARRAYGVLGPAANTAARLMQQAPAGAVFVDTAAVRLAEHRWTFKPLPPRQIKGNPKPVAVYAPQAMRLGADAPHAALVGRVRELDELLALCTVILSGQTIPVIIEGEAGIGKSCLVREFVREAQTRGFHVLQGAGYQVEAPLIYRVWRDILADYFAVADLHTPEDREQQVQATLDALRPDLAEHLPLLNVLLGLKTADTTITRGLDASLRYESLINLVAQLLLAGAKHAPMIIVLEDGQWIDPSTWEFTLRVIRQLQTLAGPLLFVMTVRSSDAEPAALAYLHILLEQLSARRVPLLPLTTAEVGVLVARHLGIARDDLPSAIVQLVEERAHGNPFFVEELIRTAREQRLLQVQTGTAHTEPIIVHNGFMHGDVALPVTLRGLLLGRIDRLVPEIQLTLKVAAVFGSSFRFAALWYLRRLYGSIDQAMLRGHLSLLSSAGFVERRLEDSELYEFRHVLIRDAAYQTLLFKQRHELHRAAARWYEETADLPLLVHHYHCAEEWAQERHYAYLAGVHAAEQFANSDAVAFFSRALELTDEDDYTHRVEILLARVWVYDLLGERAAQEADLELLAQLVERLDDDSLRARVSLLAAEYALFVANYGQAVAAAQLVVARSAPLSLDAARARAMWGWALHFQGQYGAARTQLEQALAVAQAAGWHEIEADALNGMGLVAIFQGNFAEAQRCLHHALALNRALGNRFRESAALSNLGTCAYIQGRLAEAYEYFVQDLAFMEQFGYQSGLAIGWNDLGLLAIARGDLASAQQAYERALEFAHVSNDRAIECQAGIGMGIMIFTLIGDYPLARAHLERALQLSHIIENFYTMSWALSMLSLLSYYEGDNEVALVSVVQALELAQQIEYRPGYVRSLTIQGLVLAQLGLRVQALAVYQQAIALAEALGLSYLRVEACAGRAQVLLAEARMDEALALAEVVWNHIQQQGLDSTLDPARIYLGCYHVLLACLDPRAPEVLHAAYRFVQQRAAQLTTPQQREHYIQQIVVNRDILHAFERERLRAASLTACASNAL